MTTYQFNAWHKQHAANEIVGHEWVTRFTDANSDKYRRFIVLSVPSDPTEKPILLTQTGRWTTASCFDGSWTGGTYSLSKAANATDMNKYGQNPIAFLEQEVGRKRAAYNIDSHARVTMPVRDVKTALDKLHQKQPEHFAVYNGTQSSTPAPEPTPSTPVPDKPKSTQPAAAAPLRDKVDWLYGEAAAAVGTDALDLLPEHAILAAHYKDALAALDGIAPLLDEIRARIFDALTKETA